MVYMYHSFLIHSSADGHLGCFHVLAIINSAGMNIGVHVSLSDLVAGRFFITEPPGKLQANYFYAEPSHGTSFLLLSLCKHESTTESPFL